jgi:hypothetical protein
VLGGGLVDQRLLQVLSTESDFHILVILLT